MGEIEKRLFKAFAFVQLGGWVFVQIFKKPVARVAKCHRYGRLICVNFLEVWGKILECNIRASGVG